jgi:DNA-binding phage protein
MTLAADTDLSFEYLREVLERSDRPEELLLGLRRIAEAQGMSRVAGLKLSVRPAA